jgi:hypothetical protein
LFQQAIDNRSKLCEYFNYAVSLVLTWNRGGVKRRLVCRLLSQESPPAANKREPKTLREFPFGWIETKGII